MKPAVSPRGRVLDAVGYTSLFSPDAVLPCAAVCLTQTNDRLLGKVRLANPRAGGPSRGLSNVLALARTTRRLPLLISNLTLAASSRRYYAYVA